MRLSKRAERFLAVGRRDVGHRARGGLVESDCALEAVAAARTVDRGRVAILVVSGEFPLGRRGWVRTRDLRVMSSNPISVTFDRQTVRAS
jgi:hypothetical protein